MSFQLVDAQQRPILVTVTMPRVQILVTAFVAGIKILKRAELAFKLLVFLVLLCIAVVFLKN